MGLFDVTVRETLAGAGANGRPRLGAMGTSVGLLDGMVVVVDDVTTGFLRLRTRVLVGFLFVVVDGTDKSKDFEWMSCGGCSVERSRDD